MDNQGLDLSVSVHVEGADHGQDVSERSPLLYDLPDENVFEGDNQDGGGGGYLSLPHCTQADIISQLPSHRALCSDAGYTLTRTLASRRRRGKSNKSRSPEDEEAVSLDMVDAAPDTRQSSRAGSVLRSRSGSRKGDWDAVVHGGWEEDAIRSMTSSLSVRRKYRYSARKRARIASTLAETRQATKAVCGHCESERILRVHPPVTGDT